MTDVYANKMDIACKAGLGKTIAGFPDVCLTPPSPPAGPVPVPYPNTSFWSDLQNGSKTVKIAGKPVALKDQSYCKTTPLGDEAATRTFGAGIISHQITGKTYFAAYSFDVKFEKKNVPRNLDVTTSNHASIPGNRSLVAPNLDKAYVPDPGSAVVEGDHNCECCGGKAHSAAQAEGASLTEAQFYDTANNPGNAALLGRIRASKCKHILPPAGKKPSGCNKYYVTTPPEKDRIERAWGMNADAYRKFRNVSPGSPISHRVPKAAGGCPAGQGNLAPTGKKCQKLEDQLSKVQERCVKRLRKA